MLRKRAVGSGSGPWLLASLLGIRTPSIESGTGKAQVACLGDPSSAGGIEQASGRRSRPASGVWRSFPIALFGMDEETISPC
jgi:hypothetical protein